MPEVFSILRYHVYFWLNEGHPLEPVHVHASKNIHNKATKIWLLENGKCKLDKNSDGIPKKDLKRIMHAIEGYRWKVIRDWKDKFGQVSYYVPKNER